MSQVQIATPLNIDLEFSLAPFHKRLFAWLVDIVVLLLYFKLAYLFTAHQFEKFEKTETANSHWLELIIALPAALYPLVCETLLKGQTIGKLLLKIKVINATGGNATFSQYLMRWMVRVADFHLAIIIIVLIVYPVFGALIIFMLGFVAVLAVVDFFLIVLGKKNQRMGDIAANTLLISTQTKHVLHETVFVDVEDNYVVRYPEVMRLSDRDLNTIKNIQTNLMRSYDINLAYNTASKIKHVLKIESSQEPMAFLETVLKDYNFLSTR